MFNLALYHRLSHHSAIHSETIRFFCRLVSLVDLRRPKSLDPVSLSREWGKSEDWNPTDIRHWIRQLCAAGVLVKVGEPPNSRRRGRPDRVEGIWRIPEEWWLTLDEVAQEIEEQEKWRGREGYYDETPSPLPLEVGATSSPQPEASLQPSPDLAEFEEPGESSGE